MPSLWTVMSNCAPLRANMQTLNISSKSGSVCVTKILTDWNGIWVACALYWNQREWRWFAVSVGNVSVFISDVNVCLLQTLSALLKYWFLMSYLKALDVYSQESLWKKIEGVGKIYEQF